jgi:hypothetical protein
MKEAAFAASTRYNAGSGQKISLFAGCIVFVNKITLFKLTEE